MILCGAAAQISAHRRDEYLQAARLAIDPAGVQLQLDLTPGIALAEAIISDIDRNRDGVFSDEEQRAYAGAVVTRLDLALDGRATPLQFGHAGFPSIDDIRRGEGTIALQATAILPPISAGAHRLTLRNNHHPQGAAYLANALVPESPLVTVTGQLRDTEQRVLSVDYLLRPAPLALSVSAGWLIAGFALAGASSLVLLRPLRSER